MSTETYADVEDIQKDAEEATDKKLNIRVPVKQQSASSIGSRRSSLSNVSAIKQGIVETEQTPMQGKGEKVGENNKKGQVLFEARKDTKKEKTKNKLKSKKVRAKSASASRSRSREKNKLRIKKAKQKTTPNHPDDDSDEDPDVSEIVLTKPQIKNISVEGVLPGKYSILFFKKC